MTITNTRLGQTFFKEFAYGCTRRALLDRIAQGAGQDVSETPMNLAIGQVYHTLRARYDLDPSNAWTTDDVALPPYPAEAVRQGKLLFRAWRATFAARYVGEPVGVEEELPRTEDERRAIDRLLPDSLRGYTCRPDAIHWIGRKDAAKLRRDLSLPVQPNLYYGHERKTCRALTNNLIDSHLHGLQLALYQTVAEICYPDRRFGGWIMEYAIKGPKPAFKLIVAPPPSRFTKARIQALGDAVEEKRDWLTYKNPMKAPANPTQCFYKPESENTRRCPWWGPEGGCWGH